MSPEEVSNLGRFRDGIGVEGTDLGVPVFDEQRVVPGNRIGFNN